MPYVRAANTTSRLVVDDEVTSRQASRRQLPTDGANGWKGYQALPPQSRGTEWGIRCLFRLSAQHEGKRIPLTLSNISTTESADPLSLSPTSVLRIEPSPASAILARTLWTCRQGLRAMRGGAEREGTSSSRNVLGTQRRSGPYPRGVKYSTVTQ